VHLAREGDFSGQFWSIGHDGAWLRLTTQFRGEGMCLDITNGGPLDNFAALTPCGNYSGQFWKMREEGGWYRLTTHGSRARAASTAC